MAQIKKDTTGPVALEQLKNHLHMFTDDFDASLELNLRAAIAKAESYINGRVWHGELTESVPFNNSVTVNDPTAVVTSVKVDGSQVNFTFIGGVIKVEGQGKELTYTAQVGYLPEDCPVDIQMAILMIAAKFFNNPVDSVETLPTASQHLLHPYRNYCS